MQTASVFILATIIGFFFSLQALAVDWCTYGSVKATFLKKIPHFRADKAIDLNRASGSEIAALPANTFVKAAFFFEGGRKKYEGRFHEDYICFSTLGRLKSVHKHEKGYQEVTIEDVITGTNLTIYQVDGIGWSPMPRITPSEVLNDDTYQGWRKKKIGPMVTSLSRDVIKTPLKHVDFEGWQTSSSTSRQSLRDKMALFILTAKGEHLHPNFRKSEEQPITFSLFGRIFISDVGELVIIDEFTGIPVAVGINDHYRWGIVSSYLIEPKM